MDSTRLFHFFQMSVLKKLFGVKKQGTFRRVKKLPKGSRQYCLLQHKRATLNAGDFTASIRLPEDTDLNDWLATNVVDLYNELVVVTQGILTHCTPETCRTMSAGPKYQYLWQDSNQYKTPTALPAKEYIELLFDWVEKLLDDQEVFPSDSAVPFPKNFKNVVKTIFKRLFRVYAHIYYHHIDDVRTEGVEAHFNTAFRHFYSFVHMYKLIPAQELEPLRQIIDSFSSK